MIRETAPAAQPYFAGCGRASPFLENDRDRADHHGKSQEVVPLQWFPEIQYREDRKHSQRDDLLDGLQLRRRELVGADAVGGYLETVFRKGDHPTDEDDLEQGRVAIFQMAVPGEGRKCWRGSGAESWSCGYVA